MRDDGDVRDLLESWTALIARHSADPDAIDIGRGLLAAWSEPHRRYHGISHLRDILDRIEELAPYADDADSVRLAAWYHDAVYAGLPDDEERSARRAEDELSRLNVTPELVAEVARLVRMTITHDPPPGDRDGEVLSDADLAALAVAGDAYRANTAAIRAEYAHVPDDAFRKGRSQILAALLAGPGVFRTDYARGAWEAAAQDNMRAELAGLAD